VKNLFEELIGKIPTEPAGKTEACEVPRVKPKQLFPEAFNVSRNGVFSVVCGLLDEIRTFAAKNEDLLTIAILILLFINCEDNIELLIALAIMFYPTISGLFKIN